MPGFFLSIKALPRSQKNIENRNTIKKLDINIVLDLWKRNKSPLTTKKLLQYLKPTILSALHSYAPGQLNEFRIKATKIALDSLKSYDKSKNVLPSTFVFTNLQRLNRIRRLRLNIIHIPESQVYLKLQIDKKILQLTEDLGRLPSISLICDYTGVSKAKLLKIQGNSIFSLSSSINPLTNNSTFGLKDLTDRDYYNYVYDSVGLVDKKILLWSMPFKGTPKSNNLIASRLHLSPGAVSQRKNKLQQMLSLVRGLL